MKNLNSFEALKTLANTLGYDVIKQKTMVPLLLGKNRSERGHTVRYSQLDKGFEGLGKSERCISGKRVCVFTSDGVKLIFNLNSGGRAYCGTTNGALNYKNRAVVYITDIKLMN